MHGKRVVVLMVCYTGDLAEGQRVVAPLRAYATPIADIVGPMPYPAMFEMTKAGEAPGVLFEIRSANLAALESDTIDEFLTLAPRMPSPLSMLQFRFLGGAMNRVPEDETAFAHRDKSIMISLLNTWRDANESTRQRDFIERFWTALRPHASGVYVNFLMDEGDDRVIEAHKPATYERLVTIKHRFDPENLFHVNQNIKPGAAFATGGQEKAA